MMGDTGPCGPCSEVHVDLTPDGDTRGALVNKGDPRCIEIWNLVFIQFNANPDGTFTPLPQRHVDTGMGFERVTAIIQDTKNLTDFSGTISNYETDIFRPIFDELEKLSGKNYAGTLPSVGEALRLPGEAEGSRSGRPTSDADQEKIDVAFRVIADHIRALSFAIADGIIPSNEGRGYVLRRILRRAVRYGRSLGFHETFFFKLVDVVAKTMSNMFPEIRAKESKIKETICHEEESFNRTLDRGLNLFDTEAGLERFERAAQMIESLPEFMGDTGGPAEFEASEMSRAAGYRNRDKLGAFVRRPDGTVEKKISGDFAFKLFDTYGFPLDLTELLARERGFTVDIAGFEQRMEEQRERGRKRQKKEKISVEEGDLKAEPTKFLGYDFLETESVVETVLPSKQPGEVNIVLDRTPFYAEMGGQVGDRGLLHVPGHDWTEVGQLRVIDTQKRDVEKLVNEKIAENAPVSWTEIPFTEAKQRKDIIQFFGEKYGDAVRVLQIGGSPHALNGYSMELCGGTHVSLTGEIGPFRIVKEEAIAAGTRRIEAVAGDAAQAWGKQEAARQQEKFDALARKKPDIASLPAFQDDAATAEMLKQIDARSAHL